MGRYKRNKPEGKGGEGAKKKRQGQCKYSETILTNPS